MSAELILRNGRFTTLDPSNPTATTAAIAGGVFTAVGSETDVMRLASAPTRIIDLKGRRVLPGLIDNHLHIIRGGLNFNMELRWDGVRSLADAMAMLKRQVAVTPPPPMGASRGRLHRPSVHGKTAAHHRGTQRGRSRHAGVPAASL
jgi:predicted amidohydrolase YtcJ